MIDGITYQSSGDGNEVLLCLHGIGGDARSFHHQANAFPNLNVVAWNMPGYQGSQVRKMPPDFAHLSDRLTAFIEGLGGPVHLLGQSIGGMLAIEHALRQPGQVRSLTLVATTPRFGGRDESFKEAFLKARLSAIDAGQTMAEMAAKTAPRLVGSKATDEEITRIEQWLADVPEATWRGILRCLVEFDRADDLDKLTVPTLVVAGSEDQNAPTRTMEKMAARINGARFRLLDGGGHMLHQEMPEAFNAELTEFLRDLIA